MTTRRRFLATVASTATVTGLAGCLGADGNGSDRQDSVADDELLTGVADPSDQVPPLYFSGYQYRIGELPDSMDPGEVIPRLGGNVVDTLQSAVDDVSLDDFDRVTGSIYNSAATGGGGLQFQPLPSGQSVHVTGSIDGAAVVDWLDAANGQRSLGEASGFKRYIVGLGGGQGFQAIGVRDDTLVVVVRRDVTSRSAEYDTIDATAEDALATEFDQLDSDEAPIAETVPSFAQTVAALEDGPIRAGGKYALIPMGADTGTTAFDEVVSGVTSAGISATLGTESRLQRSVSYIDREMVSEERLTAAYEASVTEDVEGWEFSSDSDTITASRSLAEIPQTAMLKTGLPVPGYESLFRRIDPTALGRDAPPRVFIQPGIEDGILRLTHGGIEPVGALEVRYVHGGSVQRESWEGPIERGDQFTSEQTVDSDTKIWVTWQPETDNAAVVMYRDAS